MAKVIYFTVGAQKRDLPKPLAFSWKYFNEAKLLSKLIIDYR